MYKRAEAFISGLRKKYTDESILIVSHGGFIGAFLTVLVHQDPHKYRDIKKPENTSVTEIELTKDSFKIISVGCKAHL
jgi:broad specificity phosphatase PhoE